MSPVNPLCSCPPSWNVVREQFRNTMLKQGGSGPFKAGMFQICADEHSTMMRATNTPLFLDLSLGTREDAARTVDAYRRSHGCLPGIAAIAYACLVATWFEEVNTAFYRVMNIFAPLLVYTVGCFEPFRTRWQITTAHMFGHFQAMVEDTKLDWNARPTSLCYDNLRHAVHSLLGYCGARPAHQIRFNVHGPLEPHAAAGVVDSTAHQSAAKGEEAVDEVVLCTHTSGASIALVEPMLIRWGGPASVALLDDGWPGESGLRAWMWKMGKAGARRVTVSLVSQHPRPSVPYEVLYPANVLRQAAIDGAQSDLILLVDPSFLPAAGFCEALSPTAALGAAVRRVLGGPVPLAAALLVASFLIFGEDEETADNDGGMTLARLRELIESGSAVAFDAHVCPLCRPHAWQWLMLMEPSALRFREVEASDLHHPVLLARKSVLPRLPVYLHGMVAPWSGNKKIGWTSLPCGLKAVAEELRASGARVLLLPGYFFHRAASSPLPSGAHQFDDPMNFFHDIAFRHFLNSLPSNASAVISKPHTLLAGPGRLVEVAPPRTGAMVTLQQGTDKSVQLVIMASIIVGSEELQNLLSSVPFTVHAVAVGVRSYWSESKRELPRLLRSLGADALVAIVDAYDMVLLPCSRSIAEEYVAVGSRVVMTAEKTCWPNAGLCTSCAQRYVEGSPDYEACLKFPYVNGGALMGPAGDLADAMEWMHTQGQEIGRDDQENKWHYYNNHWPQGIAKLDHRQRIWSQFFGCEPEAFRIEGCRVINSYTGEDVCFAHGNGGTKWEILYPLLSQLEERGCRPRSPPRKTRPYAGMATPPLIWS